MPDQGKLVAVPGSERAPMPGCRLIGPTPADARVQVTVKVRRRKSLPSYAAQAHLLPHQRAPMSRKQLADEYGANPDDIAKVEAFATQHGLRVLHVSSERRSVRLEGTADACSKAFGVTLQQYDCGGTTYRGRVGPVHVPEELAPIVTAVLGLDDRTQAWPHFRIKTNAHPGATAHTAGGARALKPTEVARLYNFPTNLTGEGQTIAILELGGGFRQEELNKYFQKLGIEPPQVNVVGVNGGENSPGDDALDPDSADPEVMLDIQVAGAVAPKARIVVYFAPDATDDSFLAVLSHAVHDDVYKPSIISISWGGPERLGTPQFQTEFNEVLEAAMHAQVTVCVAAGDNGSADFPLDDPQRPWDGHAHVDFPASSPLVLGCGGTHLEGSGSTIATEFVWHEGKNDGTGGGVSRVFPLPDWQAKAHIPSAKNPAGPVKRGVPDVAGNAAQATGYVILVDGQQFPDPTHNPPLPGVGGTSAVAPLWAGLVALLNEGLGHSVGFLNPLLYPLAGTDTFHDITDGNNGDYKAGPGWDACTGLGTPNGVKLLQALRG